MPDPSDVIREADLRVTSEHRIPYGDDEYVATILSADDWPFTPRIRRTYLGGSEGIVQVLRSPTTGRRLRMKCFTLPDENRRKRSKYLLERELPKPDKPFGDTMGGAPCGIVENVGTHTPFALLMKDVKGTPWSSLREAFDEMRTDGWPTLDVRLTWAYGLASAVREMERKGLVHGDLAPKNILVQHDGPHRGDLALIDFDAFVAPNEAEGVIARSPACGHVGYQAPEMCDGRPEVTSDRIALALLCQEMLALDAEADPSVLGRLTQPARRQQEINARTLQPLPEFAERFPELAGYLRAAVGTPVARDRPGPTHWCEELLRHYSRRAPVEEAAIVVEGTNGYGRLYAKAGGRAIDLHEVGIRARLQVDAGGRVTVTADERVMVKDHGGAPRELPAGVAHPIDASRGARLNDHCTVFHATVRPFTPEDAIRDRLTPPIRRAPRDLPRVRPIHFDMRCAELMTPRARVADDHREEETEPPPPPPPTSLRQKLPEWVITVLGILIIAAVLGYAMSR